MPCSRNGIRFWPLFAGLNRFKLDVWRKQVSAGRNPTLVLQRVKEEREQQLAKLSFTSNLQIFNL